MLGLALRRARDADGALVLAPAWARLTLDQFLCEILANFRLEKPPGVRHFFKPNTPIAQPFLHGKVQVWPDETLGNPVLTFPLRRQMPLVMTPVKTPF
jgi:hypothetical protein